jgi:hypothetical protein
LFRTRETFSKYVKKKKVLKTKEDEGERKRQNTGKCNSSVSPTALPNVWQPASRKWVLEKW